MWGVHCFPSTLATLEKGIQPTKKPPINNLLIGFVARAERHARGGSGAAPICVRNARTHAMTRTVCSKVPIALPAHEAWRLRCNFDLERHIADAGNRKLTLVSEDVSSPGTDWEQRQRQVQCELLGDHLGGSIMGVKTSDLMSEVTSHFYVHMYDEEHGAEFCVTLPLKKVKVTFEGQQWCLPASDVSCYLCTRVEVQARVVGIGSLVEMQLERQIRASHAAFPQHALDFLDQEAQKQSTSALPALPAHLSEIEPVESAAPVEPVEVVGESAREPLVAAPSGLERCRLLVALLVDSAMRMRRRHRALSNANWHVGSTVHVRMHRRHARVLLLFGCASPVVDTDEIVE